MACPPMCSDEAKEINCDPCNTDFKRKVLAVAFCEDCEDFLCQTCLKLHNRYNAKHFVISDTDSPQIDIEHCDIHTSRLLKFYCGTCDELSCVDCRNDTHKTCKSVLHLTKIVDKLEEDPRKMESYTKAVMAKTTTIRQTVEESVPDGISWKRTIQEDIKTNINQINRTFDELSVNVYNLPMPYKPNLNKYLKDAIALEKYISTYQSDRRKGGFRHFIFQKKVEKKLKRLMEGTRNVVWAKEILEYFRRLNRLKPETINDATRFDHIPWSDIHQYSRTLFQNIFFELFCLVALILYMLLRPDLSCYDEYWHVQILLVSLLAGLLVSMLGKTLLPFEYSMDAVGRCMAALDSGMVFVTHALQTIPIGWFRILLALSECLKDDTVGLKMFSVMFAFGHALVQWMGLLFSLLSFVMYVIVFRLCEKYVSTWYINENCSCDVNHELLNPPKFILAVWWIAGILLTYFFIILSSSFGIRYNELRMKPHTNFTWTRSRDSFSKLYQKMHYHIIEWRLLNR